MKELEKMSPEELFKMSENCQYAALEKIFSNLLDKKLVEIENRISSSFALQMAEVIAEKKELEKQLNTMKVELENFQKKNQELEREKVERIAFLKKVQEESKIHQERNLKLKNEKEQLEKQLQKNLKTYQEENLKLENEKEQAKEQLKNVGQKLKICQERNQSLENERVKQEGYHRACKEQISEWIPFIDTSSYEAYILSICDTKNISLIYDRMKKDYEAGEEERVKQCSQLIDDVIEISCRTKELGVLKRQKTTLGEFYESIYFDKVRGSKEIGKVTKVIYEGLERNGNLLGKSLVEVE